MDHDSNCEIVSTLSYYGTRGVQFMPDEIRALHDHPGGLFCFCQARSTLGNVTPSPQAWASIRNRAFNYTLDQRKRATNTGLARKPRVGDRLNVTVRDEDHRVIRIDFRNRKRLD